MMISVCDAEEPPPTPTYPKVPCVESMVRVTVSLPSKITVPLLLKVPEPLVPTVKELPLSVNVDPLLIVKLATVTAVDKIGW